MATTENNVATDDPWDVPPDEPSTRDFATGLRALADLLDAHPEAKQSHDEYRHLICCWSRDEMVRVVRMLGGRWEKDEDPGDYFGMTRDLGHGVTVYVYAARSSVCERVVVGTETVLVPAADALMVEVERDVVEWRCPDSLLSEVRQ